MSLYFRAAELKPGDWRLLRGYLAVAVVMVILRVIETAGA